MSAEDTETNAFERWRWNDAYWTSTWPVREQLTRSTTATLLDRLAPRPGDRVLEVGSGTGATARLVADAVGPGGEVVGADISEPLVALATRTAREEGVANLRFVLADVQTDRIEGAPFTLAMSQFGVMFFEDPVSAFANVRAHVAPGARLVFVCWQPPATNPWFAGHVLRDLMPPPAPVAPGARPTGPFAFGEDGVATTILSEAGWEGAAAERVASTAVVSHDAIADPGQPAFLGVAPERVAEANALLDTNLAPYLRDDGHYEMPVAFQVVTAVAP